MEIYIFSMYNIDSKLRFFIKKNYKNYEKKKNSSFI